MADTAIVPLKKMLESKLPDINTALPATVKKYLTPERIVKIALVAVSRSPRLMQCDPKSVLKSVMHIAEMGLEPGGPMAESHLVPFYNSTRKVYECVPIIGYRGLITLAKRSGDLSSVLAQCVYEKDKFELDLANQIIKHEPCLDGERGKLKLVYCIARFKDGGMAMDFMSKSDVDKIRNRSKAKDAGPWKSDYDEMAKKTVVRRCSKYWPMSSEDSRRISSAIEHDGDTIDGQFTVTLDPEEIPEPEVKPTRIDEVKKQLKKPAPPPSDRPKGSSKRRGRPPKKSIHVDDKTNKKEPEEQLTEMEPGKDYTEEQWEQDFSSSAEYSKMMEEEEKAAEEEERPVREYLTLKLITDTCEQNGIEKEILVELAGEVGVDLNARQHDIQKLNDLADKVTEWKANNP